MKKVICSVLVLVCLPACTITTTKLLTGEEVTVRRLDTDAVEKLTNLAVDLGDRIADLSIKIEEAKAQRDAAKTEAERQEAEFRIQILERALDRLESIASNNSNNKEESSDASQ